MHRRASPAQGRQGPVLVGEQARFLLPHPTAPTSFVIAILCSLAIKPAEHGGLHPDEASDVALRTLCGFVGRSNVAKIHCRPLGNGRGLDSSGHILHDNSVSVSTLIVDNGLVDLTSLNGFRFG